ncbi:MAG TPA: hypothetical protein VJV79_02830 [Polyangiaceae bacterium]|nr:hypothetical protein [Polyangiaceae bacterium]
MTLMIGQRYFSTLLKMPNNYWSFIAGIGLVSTGTGGSGTVTIPIGPFMHGEYITGFGVTVQPFPGGRAALPSTMPRWRLYKSSTSLTPAAPIASAVDTSASVAAYETRHDISATFAAVQADSSIWLEFDDETSAISAMILQDIFVVSRLGFSEHDAVTPRD